MTIDLTSIANAVIALIAAIITAFVIPSIILPHAHPDTPRSP